MCLPLLGQTVNRTPKTLRIIKLCTKKLDYIQNFDYNIQKVSWLERSSIMGENMIITIGRQFGSGGHEIGKRLAEQLGCKLYDKELLKLQAEHSGIAEKVLESYDESPTNSLLYSIVMDVYPSMNYVGSSLNQQVYQAQYETIRKLAESGESCVIVGRGADYILRDFPNLVSVFIHADLDIRAQRVAAFEGISVDKARDLINKSDKKRASYYNFQTEKRWGAVASYMLSVDSGALGYAGTVDLIEQFAKAKMAHKGVAPDMGTLPER